MTFAGSEHYMCLCIISKNSCTNSSVEHISVSLLFNWQMAMVTVVFLGYRIIEMLNRRKERSGAQMLHEMNLMRRERVPFYVKGN